MRLTGSLLLSSYKRLVTAAWGVTKQEIRIQPTQLAASAHPSEKRSQTLEVSVGEDACFVSEVENERQVLGVADGVGSWSAVGIDVSHFSKALMNSCAKVSKQRLTNLDIPVDIMTRALKETLWLHSKAYGSSTACILSMDCTTGLLHTANLGDSGYLVLRDGQIVSRSHGTVHYFNCPYQLSNPPPGLNFNTFSDSPSMATQSTVGLRVGDLVVLATDGLFDNMYVEDIAAQLATVKSFEVKEVEKAAAQLVERALVHSKDDKYFSPFANEGSASLSWNYLGGKQDDITVLLGAVVEMEQIKQRNTG